MPLIHLKGRRIASFDYGTRRVGYAVCDELHITVSPRKVFYPENEDFWQEIINTLETDRISATVVGIPERLDKKETGLINEIRQFIVNLKEKTGLEVFEFDESFSSKSALETMISIGKRKKSRANRENKDKTAAAVILRDFLNEYEK